MSNKNLLFSLLVSLSLLAVLTSCSEDSDNPKYQSRIPTFSDVTFEVIDADHSDIRVGDRVVATAVQSSKGKLLDRTTYTWTSSDENIAHKYKQGAVYDADNVNPTDTFTVSSTGRIRLTMTAKYQVSGQYQLYNRTDEIEDGSVTYKTLSWQWYEVTLTKYFRVGAAAGESGE